MADRKEAARPKTQPEGEADAPAVAAPARGEVPGEAAAGENAARGRKAPAGGAAPAHREAAEAGGKEAPPAVAARQRGPVRGESTAAKERALRQEMPFREAAPAGQQPRSETAPGQEPTKGGAGAASKDAAGENFEQRLLRLRRKARALPLLPGVYFMKNAEGKIIYVGKAKALRNRVSSYFVGVESHTPKVASMVAQVADFDTHHHGQRA